MKTVAFINQKGGSAKSIMSYNFGYYCAEKKNRRVLFLDGDTQGNSGNSLRDYFTELTASQFFGEAPIVVPKTTANLVVARADDKLREYENIPDSQGRLIVQRLKTRLEEAAADFDLCIIDTPGANASTVGAFLLTTDYVVVPTEIDSYAIKVSVEVLKRIVGVQRELNKKLVNLGMLPCRLRAGEINNQRRDLKGLLRDYDKYVLRACIVERTIYKEAAAKGVPIWQYTKRQKHDEYGKPVFDDKKRPVMQRVDNTAATEETLKAFDLMYPKIEGSK